MRPPPIGGAHVALGVDVDGDGDALPLLLGESGTGFYGERTRDIARITHCFTSERGSRFRGQRKRGSSSTRFRKAEAGLIRRHPRGCRRPFDTKRTWDILHLAGLYAGSRGVDIALDALVVPAVAAAA
jgi:hypothetical protein